VQRAAIKRAVAIGNRSTAKYLKISGLRLIEPNIIQSIVKNTLPADFATQPF
jgi:hypothetical protein